MHPHILVKVFAHYIDYAGLIWCLVISKDPSRASSYTGEGLCSLYWLCRTYLVFSDQQRLQLCILVYWWRSLLIIWLCRTYLVFSDQQRLQLCILVYWWRSLLIIWLCRTYLVFSDQQRPQLCILVYWWRSLLIKLILHDLPGVKWSAKTPNCVSSYTGEGICCSLYWFYIYLKWSAKTIIVHPCRLKVFPAHCVNSAWLT